MKVELQLPHIIEARKKGLRRSESHIVYTMELFDIEEIDPQDAPIVADGFDRMKKTANEGSTGVVRYHDGSFWYPEFTATGEHCTLDSWRLQMLSKSNAESRFWNSLNQKIDNGYRSWHFGSAGEYTPDNYREMSKSNIDEMRATFAQKLANEVRLIEGVVYTKVAEPLVAYATIEKAEKPWIIFSKDDVPRASYYGERNKGEYSEKVLDVCRLDKFEDIKKSWNSLGDNVDLGANFQIHIDGIFTHDDESDSLLLNTRALLSRNETFLSSFPEEAGHCWFSMKSAYKAAFANPSEDNLHALVETVAKYREAWELNGEESDYMKDEMVAHAERIVTRWQLRPIDLDASFKF